jgi:thiol-disulfide isomerase/thioredoxin
MKLNPFLLGAAALSFGTISILAARLGDSAAPLTIKDWVKGKAVDVKDGKNIYVVEFWATWCGPCKTSIPHLTEMQTRFKDKGVVFIGISDEPPSTVKPFVEKMGEKMNYTVACDDARKSSAGYMEAYGQGGIPTAFIVGKDSKVLWFGHPMGELEQTLENVLSGKYDLRAAIKKDEERAKQLDSRAAHNEYSRLAREGDEKAKALGRKLLADAGDDIDELTQFAFGIVADASNKNRDFALADEALDKAEKLASGKDPRVLGIRAIARFEAGKEDEGLKLAKEAVEACTDAKERPRYEFFVRTMESRMRAKAKTSEAKDNKVSKE